MCILYTSKGEYSPAVNQVSAKKRENPPKLFSRFCNQPQASMGEKHRERPRVLAGLRSNFGDNNRLQEKSAATTIEKVKYTLMQQQQQQKKTGGWFRQEDSVVSNGNRFVRLWK